MRRQIYIKKGSPEAASGAIVMALGIFVNGAAYEIPKSDLWGPIYSAGLILVWLFVAIPFVQLAVQRQLVAKHMTNPVRSFAAGTWIAGTSVCGIAIVKRLPDLIWLAHGMAVFAIILWIYYISRCIENFFTIRAQGLYDKTHGVILLSTVSTQSLVILCAMLYGSHIPGGLYVGFIVLGAVFYAAGFYLILKRYVHERVWNVADEWPNTNCILHGAMSITGLACAVTGVIPPIVTFVVWMWVLTWFVLVEGVECWRSAARVRKYGWREGIGAYHVTQWSRNFTFGMLYAFTMTFDLTRTGMPADWAIYDIKYAIFDYGAWVVLAFLLNEILLFLKEKLVSSEKGRSPDASGYLQKS